MCIQREPWSNL